MRGWARSITAAGRALGGIPAAVLAAVLRFYKVAVSPYIGPRCRFHPSCASYCLEAVERHGAWGGGWLGLRRLLKCHPWHPGGVDPVPTGWRQMESKERERS